MRFFINLAFVSFVSGACMHHPAPAINHNPSPAAAHNRSSGPITYDGYQMRRFELYGERLQYAKRALSKIPHDDLNQAQGFWDILIAPEQVKAIEALEVESIILHENLAESIARESHIKKDWKREVNGSAGAWFDSYHAYDDHIKWWRDLQSSFPQNSNWTVAGKSYEGRDLFGVHFWGASGPGKPAIIYHANVHAREWITTPVVEYIAKQLVDGYKAGNNASRSVLDKYDFYIYPLVNPDGFVYSQTDDRLWRKNRQPSEKNDDDGFLSCFGRDINRNWESYWNTNITGASTDPCEDDYRGEKPNDAPETKALVQSINKIRDEQTIRAFVDYHSYSQIILYPYGYNPDIIAPDLSLWTQTAASMSNTIRKKSTNDTTFTFGPSAMLLYPTSGTSMDHVYNVGGAKFSLTIELPDTGGYGFVLPPERIRPVAEEQWAGQQILFSRLG